MTTFYAFGNLPEAFLFLRVDKAFPGYYTKKVNLA